MTMYIYLQFSLCSSQPCCNNSICSVLGVCVHVCSVCIHVCIAHMYTVIVDDWSV